MAGISSNEVCKSLLCIKDLTLEKAVQHVKVDEATSFQANQFSSQRLHLPTKRASHTKTLKTTMHLLVPEDNERNYALQKIRFAKPATPNATGLNP